MISKHIRVTSTAYFRNAFPRFRNTRSSHHMERILPVSSIIPRNPDPGEKYTSVVPSIDPSKTQDLRSVPAFGPRGIVLFGFNAIECTTVRSWLTQVDEALMIASIDDFSFSPDCTLYQVLSIFDSSSRQGGLEAVNATQERVHESTSTDPIWNEGGRIVLFSGLLGEEMQGLAELWSSFTGIERVAFTSVSERILHRRLDGLIEDVLKANAPRTQSMAGSPSLSPFTVVTKNGQVQTTSKEELRQALQRKVVQKKQQRNEDEDGGGVLTKLRNTQKSKPDSNKKGFS